MRSELSQAVLVTAVAACAVGSVGCSISQEMIMEIQEGSGILLEIPPFDSVDMPLEGGVVMGVEISIGYFDLLTGQFDGVASVGDLLFATPALQTACLKPLEKLRSQVKQEKSIAHITQAEGEALKEFDAGVARIEEFAKKAVAKLDQKGTGPEPPQPVFKKQRVVEPAKMIPTPYLETEEDVNRFLETLRRELEQAIQKNERIQIR